SRGPSADVRAPPTSTVTRVLCPRRSPWLRRRPWRLSSCDAARTAERGPVNARTPYIAVVGPGDAAPEQERDAELVGGELAAAGAVVVCGGLGGVMAAACRGAQGA